ncbi:hypothetical protein CFC21_027822 [Triticum aestivum]|uniref:Uncharacterized protein n=2 Tax=Triticum aestivum TaxID=4565 RepID=A0A3B6U6Z7_WHEAT|nr:hypothetical protein CFC21_027822 [Triticum aestivum]
MPWLLPMLSAWIQRWVYDCDIILRGRKATVALTVLGALGGGVECSFYIFFQSPKWLDKTKFHVIGAILFTAQQGVLHPTAVVKTRMQRIWHQCSWSSAHRLLGEPGPCHFRHKDWARVEEDSRRALLLDDTSIKGHYLLGCALLLEGDCALTVKEFDKVFDHLKSSNSRDKCQRTFDSFLPKRSTKTGKSTLLSEFGRCKV